MPSFFARARAKGRFALLRAGLAAFPERRLFCPVPFRHMEIMQGGRASLCCWVPHSPGNVLREGLMEVWNSDQAQRIRGSILDGTFRYCNLKLCPLYRHGRLPTQDACAGSAYEDVVARRQVRLDTLRLWVGFDARCNLRCRSCRTEAWHPDEQGKRDIDALMGTVRENLESLRGLGLTGNGDPFFAPSVRSFLFEHDASAHPGMELSILTNGQLLTPENWERMAAAQPAVHSISVSVDAARAGTYEYVRRGGKFETVARNLEFVSGLRREGRIGDFRINFVVCAANYREMPEFAAWGGRLGVDHVIFSFMSDWGVQGSEGYAEQAVHLPGHPEHEGLRDVLKAPELAEPYVFRGNVSDLSPRRILTDGMFLDV